VKRLGASAPAARVPREGEIAFDPKAAPRASDLSWQCPPRQHAEGRSAPVRVPRACEIWQARVQSHPRSPRDEGGEGRSSCSARSRVALPVAVARSLSTALGAPERTPAWRGGGAHASRSSSENALELPSVRQLLHCRGCPMKAPRSASLQSPALALESVKSFVEVLEFFLEVRGPVVQSRRTGGPRCHPYPELCPHRAGLS